MMHKHQQALAFAALPSFENWKAFLEGKPSDYGYEIPLFTDARFTMFDIVRLGPYTFFRTHPSNDFERPFNTIIVMRVDVHVSLEVSEMLADLKKSDATAYHGGDLDDEIAALLSLAFGIRLSPGSPTREFRWKGEPRGIPGNPTTVPRLDRHSGGTLIPRLTRTIEMTRLPPFLQTYPLLNKNEAVALVKASRLYQQALWHSDGDTSYAWLTLVSAIETAANQWSKKGTGSKQRFIQFVLHFLPGPPEKRPEERCRFPFDKENLETALKQIYEYRSLALHEGQPFPAPMCHPAERYRGGDEPAEICLGHASGTLGGNWRHEDTPMLLHTFEHIVRTSLLAWWQTMTSACESGSAYSFRPDGTK